MANFKIIKKGYSQLEVDSYIERLVYDYESRLAEQKDRIFYLKDQLEKITSNSDNELMTSLVSAVERARLIENSSKNIYELETKKLNLLYTKMENLLKDENIYNERSVKKELLALIQDCRSSLENNVQKQKQNLMESSSGDPVKRLLTKMIGLNKIPSEQHEAFAPTKNEAKESVKKADPKHVEKLDSIFELNKLVEEQPKKYPLKVQEVEEDSGFDLKEALNPKEDLEEIMKAFDFYNDAKRESKNS
jgi:hypothetical protein